MDLPVYTRIYEYWFDLINPTIFIIKFYNKIYTQKNWLFATNSAFLNPISYKIRVCGKESIPFRYKLKKKHARVSKLIKLHFEQGQHIFVTLIKIVESIVNVKYLQKKVLQKSYARNVLKYLRGMLVMPGE